MLPDIISMLGFSSLILSHIENGKRLPLVLDTEFGLIWIAGFEYQGFELKQITSWDRPLPAATPI